MARNSWNTAKVGVKHQSIDYFTLFALISFFTFFASHIVYFLSPFGIRLLKSSDESNKKKMNLLKFHLISKLLSMTIKSKCLIESRDWSRSWLSLVHIEGNKPETVGIAIIFLKYENDADMTGQWDRVGSWRKVCRVGSWWKLCRVESWRKIYRVQSWRKVCRVVS